MPNIIEQQDLLKGLPDNRLAMMMQNPTGDIPPFLVAAEAQRRQAIRAQFSGGPEESVVDTLTKQMANVPQNIQAPAQTPPQLPPPMPPQMSGVAALQQQMPEQQMRRGGMVQRYQSLGLVSPLQTRVQDVADQFGITVDQAAEYIKNNPSLLGTKPPSEFGTAFPITEENREARATPSIPDLPSMNISPAEYAVNQQEAMREAKYQEMDSSPGYGSAFSDEAPYNSYGKTGAFYKSAVTLAAPTPPLDPTKTGTSLENQRKTSLEEKKKKLAAMWAANPEDAAYVKAELDKLYGNNELSDWEKSQKWFSAAQAAIQPGQNNWQATINALSALGGGMAEERAMQRASDREKAEALFKYGLAERQAAAADKRDYARAVFDLEQSEEDRIRAENAAAAEQYLKGAEIASDDQRAVAEMHQRSADRADQEANRLVDRMIKDGVVSPEEAERNPEVIRLRKKARDYYTLASDALTGASLGLKRYSEASGVDLSFETANGVDPIRSGQ